VKKKVLLTVLGVLLVGLATSACGTTEKEAAVSKPAEKTVTVEKTVTETVPAEAEEADDLVVEEAEADDEVGETEPADETASLGDTVEVGDWSVTVTKVALNANAAIQKANMFNEKPRGQYVLVSYDATYNGSERTADAWMDLTWTLTGNDSKILDESSTVTPAEDKDEPTEARRGGTVSLQAVFDVKPKVLHGSILSVEGYDANFDSFYADFVID
jgi:hypothetical protein